MRIEHIALWAGDLEKMRSFYMKYFNARSNEKYINRAKSFESYFLTFQNGSRLEIMHTTELLDRIDRQPQIGLAHLAFSTGSKEEVIRLTERLRNDGYSVLSEARTTGDGYFESCIADPEHNRIEITL